MKQYLAWASASYYPGGAESDFVGDFATEEEAVAAAKSTRRDFWDVLNTLTGEWSSGEISN